LSIVTTPHKLLTMWQEEHGPLSPELQARFLRHPALRQLLRYPPWRIRKVLEREPKLDRILDVLVAEDTVRRAARTEKGRDVGQRAGPRRPNDSDLHRRIGRTMKHDDDT